MASSQLQPLPNLTECCSLSTGPLTDAEATRYATLFKVLADPVRLQILSQLAKSGCGPISVSELTELVRLSQPTVSYHLKKLTEAGLLQKHRAGRTVTHSIRPELFAELRTVLWMG
ncbi:winged helix-turn-helix transcriptional regulator [Corynebacterium qintianiae]|uniref:Winged helix-turn-helix transcriptional regulator n=1 Tax=Corynebacterium qintianiae TaxID=2709392 RepID=A0A7T0KMX0_9CORY|nr:metalloregulator ArsR/SmtB family transcription factor [Corynebacterium qintianiae]QPK83414.1 winged helix-turn-helix transcriptional regulator [Corynebacterium qintianiae]